MTAAELGKIIKEARLAKKMTQSEVVGSFITRNMLSRIESGAATPSIKTLEYLTGVLDLPPLKLSEESESDYELLCRGKAALHIGDFSGALCCEGISGEELSDERSAVLARAYLGLSSAEPDAVKSAEFAKLSADYAGKGLYASGDIRNEAMLRLGIAVQRLEEKVNNGS